MAVNVIARLKIKNGANEPIAEGPDIASACAVVANTTARDAILTNVKGSSYLVYRVDLPGFEYWNGSTWASVASGGAGGGAGFPFTFDSSTTDADPGAGEFRLNNATPASATAIYIDDVEAAEGTNVRDLIASYDDAPGSIKGYLRLQDTNDPENWIVYAVGGYTSATGYGKLTGLTVIDSSATVTFTGDVFISFDAGQAGTTPVTAIAPGTAGQEVRTNSGGTAAEWFTPTSFKRGTNLVGTANTTVTRAGGTLYEMLAGVTTAARDIRCGATSLNSTTHRRFIYAFVINVQAHDVVIKDDVAGTTLHTVPAGEKQYVVCEWDGFNFVAGDWGDLN